MILTNKTIVITGGTSGIGEALAIKLKTKQNKVIVLGRNKEALDELYKKGICTLKCDITDSNEVEEAIDIIRREFNHVDVLFNNAGIQYNYDFQNDKMPYEQIDKEITINLTAQILFTQSILPLMKVTSDAIIVNTTSALGAFPKSNGIVYSASKAGFRNYTKGLRYFLKNKGIDVVEFIPPVTATNMTASRDEKKMPVDDLIAKILPQLEKGKKRITVSPVPVFLKIAILFPGLAHKIMG